MNTDRRQTALLVVVLVLPALLAFGVVRLLGASDGAQHRAERSEPSGPADPARPVDSGPAVDLAARFTAPQGGTELTFQIARDRAEAGPPPQVTDCRRFAEWAQRSGGVPVAPEPAHLLSVHARRDLDVTGVSVVAVPIAQVTPTEEDGPWVELACRDDAPAPTARASDEGQPSGTEAADGAPDRPHVLTTGQTIELPVTLQPPSDTGEVLPHGVSDYRLQVRIEIDGVEEQHLLPEGSASFRCCGRTTFMGFQAARYEWRLSPSRSLRRCAELRYVEEPPLARCETGRR